MSENLKTQLLKEIKGMTTYGAYLHLVAKLGFSREKLEKMPFEAVCFGGKPNKDREIICALIGEIVLGDPKGLYDEAAKVSPMKFSFEPWQELLTKAA